MIKFNFGEVFVAICQNSFIGRISLNSFLADDILPNFTNQ